MGLALTRSCVLAAVVAFCGLVTVPAFAASDPVGLTVNPVSDTSVELNWSWPVNVDYPAELDVYRDGVFRTSVPESSTKYFDSGMTPGSAHSYQLMSDSNPLTPVFPVFVTLRADLPNPPTNVTASFSAANLATVTWDRGDSDSDVTYQVTADPVGGGTPVVTTARYPVDNNNPGSAAFSGFANYTQYRFTVSANEDGGGSAAADPTPAIRSNDLLSPQWNGGTLSASRLSLGTISATWSTGSDSGSGIASYSVCVDLITCSTLPIGGGGTQTASLGNGAIRNDGLSHSVSVVATDGAGNQSVPLSTVLVMPVLVPPTITVTGGNGCAPLVAHATSPDAGAAYHLFVDGATSETPLDQPIAGSPYQQLTLVANATFGADSSAISGPLVGRVYDPDGPDTSPTAHVFVDRTHNNTTQVTWDPITTSGAPIIGYEVTIPGLPAYENGSFLEQATAPEVDLYNLDPTAYIVQVTAVDGCYRQSPPVAVPPRFNVNDTEPPTAPGLAVPVTGGHDVRLSWTPSTDNVAVDDYKVFQNGALVTRTDKTTYDITGLPDAWPANYTVVATDTAGNPSASSVMRTATTKDVTAPVFPGSLTAVPQGANVALKWSAATDNVGVSVYQILRAGVPIMNVTGLTFTDKDVAAGIYQYDVRAFDAAGNGSILHSATAKSDGPPKTTIASALRVVKWKGAKTFKVWGGSSGARIVISFTLPETYPRATLRLQVVKSTVVRGKAQAKVKARTKLRVSLPMGTGRTLPGTRLAERVAKKGILLIPLKGMPKGPLRLILTATGGTVTIAGTGAGPNNAPAISPLA
jgi:hypothetical protein